MNKFEKISELLEKRNLSPEEKSQLVELITNDSEAKEFYEAYVKLGIAIKSGHISLEDMSEYILYKNNSEPENKNIIGRIPEIELHLKRCENCLQDFKTLNAEYSDIQNYVSDKIPAKSKSGYDNVYKNEYSSYRYSKRIPVYAFASIILIGLIYTGLYFTSTSENYDLASVSDKSEFYVTRGRATDEFQESLKALEENDFNQAIIFLEQDIKKNSDETVFYSHYILGLTYLEKAEKSFIGLFKSFNKDDAEKGLKSLQLCIEKNTSGKFPDITYNAYFYSAKANLMLVKNESATK
jgi:hypothetical protein